MLFSSKNGKRRRCHICSEENSYPKEHQDYIQVVEPWIRGDDEVLKRYLEKHPEFRR